MARSGSENRKRSYVVKFRVTAEEYALIREQADRAGLSVAAVARHAVLDQKPLRASRQPSINEALGTQLLGQLGQTKLAFKQAAEAGNPNIHHALFEAGCRDLGEMRNRLFEAYGWEP